MDLEAPLPVIILMPIILYVSCILIGTFFSLIYYFRDDYLLVDAKGNIIDNTTHLVNNFTFGTEYSMNKNDISESERKNNGNIVPESQHKTLHITAIVSLLIGLFSVISAISYILDPTIAMGPNYYF
jgi:hypothetical protein